MFYMKRVDNPMATATRLCNRVLKNYELYFSSHPIFYSGYPSTALRILGDYERKNGRLFGALSYYLSAINYENPKTHLNFEAVAEIYEALGDYSSAATFYKRASECDISEAGGGASRKRSLRKKAEELLIKSRNFNFQ